VVLRNDFEVIKKEITAYRVVPVYNPNRENEMEISISKGIMKIQNLNPTIAAAIILLVDQPLVKPNLLSKLEGLYYQKSKKVIQGYMEKAEVGFADFPEGQIDFDTQRDYERFLNNCNKKNHFFLLPKKHISSLLFYH
jgi:hypothetical protein